jgi:hypothetical protein
MLAFEIWVDDERLCVAGIADWALLSVGVTGRRHRHPDAPRGDDIELDVGALSGPDATGVSHHVRWNGRTLHSGTKVTIQIVETESPDQPTRRYRSDKEVQEEPFTDDEIAEFERATWLRLKAKFEPER